VITFHALLEINLVNISTEIKANCPIVIAMGLVPGIYWVEVSVRMASGWRSMSNLRTPVTHGKVTPSNRITIPRHPVGVSRLGIPVKAVEIPARAAALLQKAAVALLRMRVARVVVVAVGAAAMVAARLQMTGVLVAAPLVVNRVMG
jgi:hypothetical protein